LFDLPQLLTRLDTRLSLLTSGRRDAPARQRTLRATLDWSYGLLDAGEQQTLARVAIFAGGFSVAAAEVVCDASLDELAALVEQNLIRRHDGRLTLLETIREYGLERLVERGEERDLRRRHANWFVGLAERASAALYGADQVAWLDRLELELENVRAALAFLLDVADVNGALRLTSSLWIFWEARAPVEGRRALQASLEHCAGADRHLVAGAVLATGHLLFFEGDLRRAATYFEDAVRAFRQLGDDAWLAVALARLSWVALDTGRTDELLAVTADALAVLEGVTEPWARAETLNYAGTALAQAGEAARGRALLEQSREMFVAMGNDQRAAEVLNNLGWVAMLDGDFDAARRHHHQNLDVARRIRDGFRLSLALGNLGLVEALAGDLEAARPIVRENLIVLQGRDAGRNIAEALVVAAAILASRGDHEEAGRLLGASEAIYERGGGGWNHLERQVVDAHVLGTLEAAETKAFDRARVEGRTMTDDEAIAGALAALD
jgi:predicted ATPase